MCKEWSLRGGISLDGRELVQCLNILTSHSTRRMQSICGASATSEKRNGQLLARSGWWNRQRKRQGRLCLRVARGRMRTGAVGWWHIYIVYNKIGIEFTSKGSLRSPQLWMWITLSHHTVLWMCITLWHHTALLMWITLWHHTVLWMCIPLGGGDTWD